MKLVSESLDMYNFEKKSDPLVSLEVGQIALITKWLDEMNVKDYTINDDFTIDVNGDVDLSDKNLVKFPDYIKFSKVKGGFYCYNNQLVSLEGCPEYVTGAFWCENNKLSITKDYIRSICIILLDDSYIHV
jgi:hypothetical protein